MNKEKIILSFIATLIGLFVTGGAFYFYQNTKTVPQSNIKIISISPPTSTPKSSIFLTLSSPDDESVVNQRIINVSGKTTSDAIIVILTQRSEQVVTPASNGNFSATVNIDNGENVIEITAIAPNGEDTKITKAITYSTEEF